MFLNPLKKMLPNVAGSLKCSIFKTSLSKAKTRPTPSYKIWWVGNRFLVMYILQAEGIQRESSWILNTMITAILFFFLRKARKQGVGWLEVERHGTKSVWTAQVARPGHHPSPHFSSPGSASWLCRIRPARKDPAGVRNSSKHIATGWHNWESVKRSGFKGALFPPSWGLGFINTKAAALCDCFLLGTVYRSEEACSLSKSVDFMLEVSMLLFYMKLTGVFFRFVFFLIWFMQDVERFWTWLRAGLRRKLPITVMLRHYSLHLVVYYGWVWLRVAITI